MTVGQVAANGTATHDGPVKDGRQRASSIPQLPVISTENYSELQRTRMTDYTPSLPIILRGEAASSPFASHVDCQGRCSYATLDV